MSHSFFTNPILAPAVSISTLEFYVFIIAISFTAGPLQIEEKTIKEVSKYIGITR